MEKLAEVAHRLNTALNATRLAEDKLPALFFFTDEARTPDPLGAITRLPTECAVVFRHYGVNERAALARQVVELCHRQRRKCLIAEDVELARLVGADGLHMTERMLREQSTLLRSQEDWIITAAAHSAEALKIAGEIGVDAAFLSPVFATKSHPGGEPLGAQRFAELVHTADLPVYALGGVTDKTAPQLLGSGAVGIGAIGALLSE